MLWMWIYWSQNFTALSKIQNIVYGCKRGQKWRTGTQETHLKERTFLPSLNQVWLWKSCSAAWSPQNAPTSLYFCSLTSNSSAVFGNIFPSPVTLLPAVLHLRCNALLPPHLLKHEISYWGSTTFQALEALEMTRTDIPTGAAWRNSDTFPTFMCVFWVSLIWK